MSVILTYRKDEITVSCCQDSYVIQTKTWDKSVNNPIKISQEYLP